MAMVAGTVAISDAGVVTGADLARALYDAHIVKFSLMNEGTPPEGISQAQAIQANVATRRYVADQANAYASALVTYLQANAQAKVATTLGGLQVAGGIATSAPLTDQFIPIV